MHNFFLTNFTIYVRKRKEIVDIVEAWLCSHNDNDYVLEKHVRLSI